MIDLKLMHKKWLTSTTVRDEEYYSELTGFVEAMKEHLFRSSDWMESKSKIGLPFTVQTLIIEKVNLAWRDDSTCEVYIRFKAFDENYAKAEDNEGFEIM